MKMSEYLKGKSPETVLSILQVHLNANAEWERYALACIAVVASTHSDFTADEVAEQMARKTDAPKTHEPRAMGAVMLKAAAEGLIDSTEEFKASTRSSTHNSPRRVWRSLIFKPSQVNLL
jgi:hypothetical protein